MRRTTRPHLISCRLARIWLWGPIFSAISTLATRVAVNDNNIVPVVSQMIVHFGKLILGPASSVTVVHHVA